MVPHNLSAVTALIDVLDRVLDKGVVFDAGTQVSAAGIDLITVGTRVIVASIDTYLSYLESRRVLFIVAADQRQILRHAQVHPICPRNRRHRDFVV